MRPCRTSILLAAFALASCGGGEPPTVADAQACVRGDGAELTRGDPRNPLYPPGTRSVLEVQWAVGGEAVIQTYDDEDAAREAETRTKKLVLDFFNTDEEQVRRVGRFVVLLGPVEPPDGDRQDALFDCLR